MEVRAEKEVLPVKALLLSKFVESWVYVARMVHVNGPTLNSCKQTEEVEKERGDCCGDKQNV